jgi:hypothetical protein
MSLKRRVKFDGYRYDWKQFDGYYVVETYQRVNRKWVLKHVKQRVGVAPTEPGKSMPQKTAAARRVKGVA